MLGHIAEPWLPHFVELLVRQRHKVDLAHVQVAHYLTIILKDPESPINKLRLAFLTAVLVEQAIKDFLGHQDEVHTFTQAFSELMVLPLGLDCLVRDLVVSLWQEQIRKADTPWVLPFDSSQVDRGIVQGCVDHVDIAPRFPFVEPLFG